MSAGPRTCAVYGVGKKIGSVWRWCSTARRASCLAGTCHGPGRPVTLGQALIKRYGTLGRLPEPILLRSDNGLIFTNREYTHLVRSYGLKHSRTGWWSV